MEIAKALILAGRGNDDRPWPTAPSGAKHLFPVANRPILFHNLEALRSAGVLEAAILADPAAGDAIEQAVGDGRDWGLSVTHVEWPRSGGGLAGALATSHGFLADEPVLVQEGDALLRDCLHPHIAAFARERLDTLALRLDPGAGKLPRRPAPGYLLSPLAVSILLDGSDPANPVTGVRARGGRVRVQRVDGWLPCHGGQDALLESNQHMLERIGSSYDPASLQDCRVQGRVVVHPTALVRRSLLRGPAIIGPGARITDAYVGPYTSLGPRVTMEATEIEYSIVLADAELRFVGTKVESSVIGRGARIVRGFDLPAALRMSIGDRAEVVLR
jgi:glucose-1-phosphate thymidylyltransferase